MSWFPNSVERRFSALGHAYFRHVRCKALLLCSFAKLSVKYSVNIKSCTECYLLKHKVGCC